MHIIHQIRVESRAGNVRLARKVDRAVAECLDTAVPARLDECFGQMAGDRTLRIDRMEIDLGAMSWKEFQNEFPERVAAAVMQRLRPEPLPPGGEKDGASEVKLELPQEGEPLEAWAFFLRHGHLPWWFADARWDEISSVRDLHAADPEGMIGALRKLATEAPSALIRLARHATAEELGAVFGIVRAVADLAPRVGEGPAAVNVIAAWLGRLPNGAETLVRMFPQLSRAEQEALGAQALPETRMLAPSEAVLLETRAGHTPKPGTSTPSKPVETVIPTSAGQRVGSAGLVLLHPFLTRFFRHLGFLDDAGGLHSDFRWQAVQALQFLALGTCGLPEPTLVMEKTLCGIPLHEVAAFPVLENTIPAECDHLLEAVIAHWSVLGKTSPSGLRESFLARPGILRFEGPRVVLTVEKRPYDMLLDKLPWPAGPVMCKWLSHPIRVRWREEP